MQSPTLVSILKQHTHDFTFDPADCTTAAYCKCGQVNGEPLGHLDENTDNSCDRCEWRMDAHLETVKTHLDDIKGTDKINETAGTITFDGTEFNVVVGKGSGSLNKNGTNHVRVQNYNNLTISANNGKKMISITFVVTSESYVDELQLFLESAGYTNYTTDGLEITIELDSLSTVTLSNTSKKSARIATVKIAYVDGTESAE